MTGQDGTDGRKKHTRSTKKPKRTQNGKKHHRLQTNFGPIQLPHDYHHLRKAMEIGDVETIIPSSKRKTKGTKSVLPKWEPPADMPRWQAILVATGHMCGVKQRKYLDSERRLVYSWLSKVEDKTGCTQLYCRMTPPAVLQGSDVPLPHRCYPHGGARAADGMARRRRREQSFYASVLQPDEADQLVDLVEGSDISNVDFEIALTKVRLRRAVLEETEARELLKAGKEERALALFGIKKKKGSENGKDFELEETDRRMIDFEVKISRIMRQLTKLLEYKLQASGGGGDLSADELAANVRSFVAQSMGLHSVEPEKS